MFKESSLHEKLSCGFTMGWSNYKVYNEWSDALIMKFKDPKFEAYAPKPLLELREKSSFGRGLQRCIMLSSMKRFLSEMKSQHSPELITTLHKS